MTSRLPAIAPRPSRAWALGALLLTACGEEQPAGGLSPGAPASVDAGTTPAPSDAATSPAPGADSGANGDARAAVPPDARPCTPPSPAGAPRAEAYPPAPYGIGHCQTVGDVTFKRSDDTPLSLADIRRMASVEVIVVLEAGSNQVSHVQRLTPIYAELAAQGVYVLAVLAESGSTAAALAAWEAAAAFPGTSVHGSRIAGPGGITSGYPNVYIIQADTMQIHTRITGFATITTDSVRTATLQALDRNRP